MWSLHPTVSLRQEANCLRFIMKYSKNDLKGAIAQMHRWNLLAPIIASALRVQ